MGASRSVMLAQHPSPSSPPRKYALPPNRVLLPAARHAPRLRPTHNGNALLAAGTIRGSRQSQQGCLSTQQESLGRHRLFHSDPDISRGRNYSDKGRGSNQSGRDHDNDGRVYNGKGRESIDNDKDSTEKGRVYRRENVHNYSDNSSIRSGRDYNDNKGRSHGASGGVASARKCRQKKSRAPQPPPSGRQDLASSGRCKCIVAKTRAPPPPPPPPPDDGATTRTAASWESSAGGGYEKKVPALEKWRHCRSAGDLREDPFKEEIKEELQGREATRQRAQQQQGPPKFYFGAPSPPRGRSPSPVTVDVLRLRPVLPRRPPEFSAPWRHSSSDSGDDEGGRTRHDWTPRQDLSDDGSDDEPPPGTTRVSSEASEIRFPLPAVMFSNRRPLGDAKGRGLGAEDANHRREGRGKMDIGRLSNSHWASGRPGAAKGRSLVDVGGEKGTDSNWASGRRGEGRSLVEKDSNWTFGLTKHGRQYSSELLLTSKKRNEMLDNFLLGDVLAAKTGQMNRSSNFSLGGQAKKSSDDSGHSNFSFYSTDGRVAFEPPQGRVSEIRRRFDANTAAKSAKGRDKHEEAGRRRDLQLARMLEDEVRKRRNREKAGLREELRRLKKRMDEDDEAYFTEPKSSFDSLVTTTAASSRLSHWQSSPALLEDASFATPPVVGVSRPWSSSSSPSPVPPPRRGGGRGDSVYKRLMDIVRREERHLDAQRTSDTSPTPTSSSCGDSSAVEGRGNARQDGAKAFLQPYSHYRPIHFHLQTAAPTRKTGLEIS